MPKNAALDLPQDDDDDIVDLLEVVKPGKKISTTHTGDFNADLDAVLSEFSQNTDTPAPFPDPSPVDHVVDLDETLTMPSMTDLDNLLESLSTEPAPVAASAKAVTQYDPFDALDSTDESSLAATKTAQPAVTLPDENLFESAELEMLAEHDTNSTKTQNIASTFDEDLLEALDMQKPEAPRRSAPPLDPDQDLIDAMASVASPRTAPTELAAADAIKNLLAAHLETDDATKESAPVPENLPSFTEATGKTAPSTGTAAAQADIDLDDLLGLTTPAAAAPVAAPAADMLAAPVAAPVAAPAAPALIAPAMAEDAQVDIDLDDLLGLTTPAAAAPVAPVTPAAPPMPAPAAVPSAPVTVAAMLAATADDGPDVFMDLDDLPDFTKPTPAAPRAPAASTAMRTEMPEEQAAPVAPSTLAPRPSAPVTVAAMLAATANDGPDVFVDLDDLPDFTKPTPAAAAPPTSAAAMNPAADALAEILAAATPAAPVASPATASVTPTPSAPMTVAAMLAATVDNDADVAMDLDDLMDFTKPVPSAATTDDTDVEIDLDDLLGLAPPATDAPAVEMPAESAEFAAPAPLTAEMPGEPVSAATSIEPDTITIDATSTISESVPADSVEDELAATDELITPVKSETVLEIAESPEMPVISAPAEALAAPTPPAVGGKTPKLSVSLSFIPATNPLVTPEATAVPPDEISDKADAATPTEITSALPSDTNAASDISMPLETLADNTVTVSMDSEDLPEIAGVAANDVSGMVDTEIEPDAEAAIRPAVNEAPDLATSTESALEPADNSINDSMGLNDLPDFTKPDESSSSMPREGDALDSSMDLEDLPDFANSEETVSTTPECAGATLDTPVGEVEGAVDLVDFLDFEAPAVERAEEGEFIAPPVGEPAEPYDTSAAELAPLSESPDADAAMTSGAIGEDQTVNANLHDSGEHSSIMAQHAALPAVSDEEAPAPAAPVQPTVAASANIPVESHTAEESLKVAIEQPTTAERADLEEVDLNELDALLDDMLASAPASGPISSFTAKQTPVEEQSAGDATQFANAERDLELRTDVSALQDSLQVAGKEIDALRGIINRKDNLLETALGRIAEQESALQALTGKQSSVTEEMAELREAIAQTVSARNNVSEIHVAQADVLAQTNNDLAQTREELTQTRKDLEETRALFASVQANIEKTAAETAARIIREELAALLQG